MYLPVHKFTYLKWRLNVKKKLSTNHIGLFFTLLLQYHHISPVYFFCNKVNTTKGKLWYSHAMESLYFWDFIIFFLRVTNIITCCVFIEIYTILILLLKIFELLHLPFVLLHEQHKSNVRMLTVFLTKTFYFKYIYILNTICKVVYVFLIDHFPFD